MTAKERVEAMLKKGPEPTQPAEPQKPVPPAIESPSALDISALHGLWEVVRMEDGKAVHTDTDEDAAEQWAWNHAEKEASDTASVYSQYRNEQLVVYYTKQGTQMKLVVVQRP